MWAGFVVAVAAMLAPDLLLVRRDPSASPPSTS
jgi:hypothetical protein